MDLFDIAGDTVLVVGGAGLIGTELTRGLTGAGADVFVADLPGSGGDELATATDGAEFVPLDVSDPKKVRETVKVVSETGDGINAAVNCSYPRTESYGDDAFWETEFGEWTRNVELHLGSYFCVARAVARSMRKDNIEGSIINFGSIYGVRSPQFGVYGGTHVGTPSEYAAIKAGITNLTRYLAAYLGPIGIRVNTVSPGGVYDGQDSEFVENYEQRVPLGRMAAPEDTVGAVVYLVSDAAAYVTGHNLVVDGGWTAQ